MEFEEFKKRLNAGKYRRRRFAHLVSVINIWETENHIQQVLVQFRPSSACKVS